MAAVRFVAIFVAVFVTLDTTQMLLAQEAKLPDYIKICKRNDPRLSDCITQTVEDIRPYLAKGIPELNVPSIEPLLLEEIVAGGSNLFKVSATNINAYGCSNFKINRMSIDMDKYEFSFDLDLPLLNIDANYNVNGRLLLIPIRGNGPMKLNITDCKAQVELLGQVYEKNGAEYLNFTSMDVRFVIGEGSVRLDNLFGGQKTLGEAINTAINANFGQFLTELKPSIERELSATMLGISNNVVSSFTMAQLFPED